jgi:hypothetical protein
MRKKESQIWGAYGISLWVAGFVLLANGIAELLMGVVDNKLGAIVLVANQDYWKGGILSFFGIILLLIAFSQKSRTQPDVGE